MQLKLKTLVFCAGMILVFAPLPGVAKTPFDQRLVEAERYRVANDFPNALPRYEALVKMRPANGRLRANYGMLLVQTGNFLGGKEEIDRALTLNPDEPAAHQALAVYYMVMNDRDNAKKEFIKTIALDPKRNCHCAQIQRYLGITPDEEKEAIKKGTKGGGKGAAKGSARHQSATPKEKPFQVW